MPSVIGYEQEKPLRLSVDILAIYICEFKYIYNQVIICQPI